MRPTCRLTARARADIDGIAVWIATGGSRARAISFTQELEARCAQLVDFPEAARLRPEYGAGVRVVPFGCFLILYRWQAERRTVVVSRIVGAAQRPGPVA